MTRLFIQLINHQLTNMMKPFKPRGFFVYLETVSYLISDFLYENHVHVRLLVNKRICTLFNNMIIFFICNNCDFCIIYNIIMNL